MAYAAQYPDSVASMLLITPPSSHLTNTPSDKEEITSHRKGEPTFDAAVAAFSREVTTQPDFDTWLADTAPATYASWTEETLAHSQVGATSIATAGAFFSVAPPADFPQLLGRTRAKVRILAGAQDYTTGLAPVLAAATLFAHGDVVVIDGSGHFPWVEQPEAFRRAADPFVAQ
jgi:pimeloyl-ACP methyl ester carboxylesterase